MTRSLFSNTVRPFGAGLVLWLLGALLISAQAAPNRLESIQTTALGSGEAAIVLTLAGPAPKPSVFTVTKPAQLSIDLANTTLDVEQRYRQVKAGPVTGLTLAADGNRTRVVVQLTQPASYSVERNGNEIRIVVHTGSSAPAGASAVANRVTDIDFRRGANGSGRVEISLSGTGGPIDIDEQDGRITATLPNTYLPDNLEKRLDVMDFATPVQFVDVFAHEGNTRVVVTPASGAHYKRMAYQSGNQFVLELEPVTQAEVQREREQQQSNEPEFSGEKISLSFQKVDIRAVLQIIADVADVNMVVSDNVSGQITLRLENVPWDQALNIVLRAQGLGMRRIGNVISVAPLAQIAQRERAQMEAYEATRNLSPLQSEIIQINYAKASEIATLVQSGGSGETAMLSKRGRVTVDQRTNSLLITDTATKLQNIRRVIDRLDIPVRQVLIEARIVVANRDFSRELGVTMAANDKAAFESPTDGNYLADTGFTVNLPVAGPAGTLTTSIIGDTFSLDLALSALETENRGEIVSSPRVITTDGQEAVIEQGQEVPYTTQQGSDDPATTEFKEVVLNLTVTPHITPNEHVLLEMDLTQDNVSGFSPDGEPIIDTRSVQTQVLVDDGNTVVLGGIYQQKHSNSESRVPILGDLPLIGALFSGTARQHEKLELLIFITPKILQETLTAK